ncbi:MAG: response regulator [Lachnospiraceae bacterium]|nr:response regulator [Candidatus Merdinaster equi]
MANRTKGNKSKTADVILQSPKKLYNSLSLPMIVVDASGTICLANKIALEKFRLVESRVEALEYTIHDVVNDEDVDLFSFEGDHSVCKCYVGNPSYYGYVQIDKLYESDEDVPGNQHIGYIIAVKDLTEEFEKNKKLQEMIEKTEAANRSKSAFLANMSHEIRTPMNAIIGLSELMLKIDNLPDVAKEYARDIKISSQGLLAIVNDILDISKIESGKMEIIEDSYYIARMLQDVSLIIRTQVMEKKLDFKVNVDGTIPCKLYGDKVRIRGVLINILNNAVKYTNSGSVTFDISAEKKNDDIVNIIFKVTDTGCGIKAEDLPRLFDSFAQVDQKIHEGVEGTGLGLAIAMGYTRLMGGDITVASEYGKGSTFTIVIPQKVLDSEPMRWSFEGKSTEVSTSIGNLKVRDTQVLIVDDSRMNLKVASNVMKQYGLITDTATSGAQAIEMCKEKKYEIIFMDQMMPEMDGIEAMGHIRNEIPGYDRDSGCKIVVLTANAINGMREELMAQGFDEYLGKPMNYGQLENVIKRFIPSDRIYYEE